MDFSALGKDRDKYYVVNVNHLGNSSVGGNKFALQGRHSRWQRKAHLPEILCLDRNRVLCDCPCLFGDAG